MRTGVYLLALMVVLVSGIQAQTIELVKDVNPGDGSSMFFLL